MITIGHVTASASFSSKTHEIGLEGSEGLNYTHFSTRKVARSQPCQSIQKTNPPPHNPIVIKTLYNTRENALQACPGMRAQYCLATPAQRMTRIKGGRKSQHAFLRPANPFSTPRDFQKCLCWLLQPWNRLAGQGGKEKARIKMV